MNLIIQTTISSATGLPVPLLFLDGEMLPGQRDVKVNYPFKGLPSVVVEFLIDGKDVKFEKDES